ERRCLGLPDAELENSSEARKAVASVVREFRPRVVVTHWKVGRHRDHRVASEMVRDACFLSGLKKLDAPGDPFRPQTLVYATAFREDAGPPDFVVDVTEAMERKLEALACYGTQLEGRSQLGEVYPGGDRPVVDQLRAQMAHYGSLIRVPYGEPFRVDEALEVDTLESLTVSTF
ncbi:MAG: PIG-L family deacetylase, partial [Gemmatimonadota bacterium]|nr:PIG-L family deacetylase [Gemmatimonadota bacterium]